MEVPVRKYEGQPMRAFDDQLAREVKRRRTVERVKMYLAAVGVFLLLLAIANS